MTDEPKKNAYGSPYTLGMMVLVAIAVYRAPEIIKAIKGDPAPVIPPVSVDTNWRQLVPEEGDRQQLASYLDAWSRMIPQVKDLGHFSTARKVGDPVLQETSQLTGELASFDKALSKRLEKAMGGNLDPSRKDLAPLANELSKVAGELRQ